MRVKAVIAYRGEKFYGFQRQKSTTQTVTQAIEEALISLHIDSPIVGSGRTDAGVHATGQVIHIDLPHFWIDTARLKDALNSKLKYISFRTISIVDESFHARFSATRRIYRYIFSPQTVSIFHTDTIAHIPIVNIDKLEEALSEFEGRHDFSYFIKSGSETKDNIRTVYKSRLIKRDHYHYIYMEGNGFLRAQVRMMIGAALEVANDKISIEELRDQLRLRNIYTRKLVPPQGLYLAKVLYR